MAEILYMQLLGSLLYIANSTRPDILYAVSELARYANDPGREHWTAFKRVLRYLKGTKHLGLTYGNGNLDLHGFVDASYARCVDTRRSRYGGIVVVKNAPVEWRSKMQPNVAVFSLEAEYIGASETTKLHTWFNNTLKVLSLVNTKPAILKIDNKSAITFADEHIV